MSTADGSQIEQNDEDGKMTVDAWIKCWDTPNPGFHSTELNEYFVEHRNKVLTKGKMKVFVPMCGKAVEMKWLGDQGHKVVGLEVAENACQMFFEDNNISYTKTPLKSIKGDLYSSEDDKIKVKIYCCDYFQFTTDLESGFEAVWDCGALTSVDIEDQGRYLDTLKPLMAKGCKNLTELTVSNSWPSGISTEKMKQYLGEDYSVTEIGKFEASEQFKAMDVDFFQLFLIIKNE